MYGVFRKKDHTLSVWPKKKVIPATKPLGFQTPSGGGLWQVFGRLGKRWLSYNLDDRRSLKMPYPVTLESEGLVQDPLLKLSKSWC